MKIKMFKLCILLILMSFIFTVGFTSSDKQIIDDLTKRIGQLETKYDLLNQMNATNSLDIMNLKAYEKVYFDATKTDSKFRRLDNSVGIFYISLQEVIKNGSNYTLKFIIGNPQYCTYEGCNITIEYNVNMGSKPYIEWTKLLKTKEYKLNNVKLLPGSWNPITIDIPVSSINEIAYIQFTMNIDTVLLTNLSNTSNISNNSFIYTADSVIESKIDGDFEGFDYGNIYKLINGQVWKQTSYEYKYKYKYSPKVIIYKSGLSYKMIVDGIEGEITVIQIK